MKRNWITLLAVCFSALAFAQDVAENESAVVYYMPKTTVNVVVHYMEIRTTVGPFYQYSERYLGTKDVVTENAHYFEIGDVEVRTRVKADRERGYTLPLKSKAAARISLAKDGTLLGYNLLVEAPSGSKKADKKATSQRMSMPMPLLEEQMLAANKSKMAESTAKQIYRIREARLNLLTGDVEHLPADGKAMKLTLDGLQEQEEALVALFVGKADTIWHTQSLLYTPEENADVENVVIGRFSEAQGVLPVSNLAGAPVYLSLSTVRPAAYSGKPKGTKVLPTLYYNQPAWVLATVADEQNTYASSTIPVAQWGVSLPIEESLLTDNVMIRLTSAGAIESISAK